MRKDRIVLLLFIFCLIFLMANINRSRANASSFLSNDNITRVTLKVLSCDDEKDPDKKEKCKNKKSESEKPRQKLVPVIISNSTDHSNNPVLELVNYFWRLFSSSAEGK